nr:hypothetical protein KPHV_85510 [Kitasatospora purpeofusca]
MHPRPRPRSSADHGAAPPPETHAPEIPLYSRKGPMPHSCPDCGGTAASLTTTAWIDIFAAEPPSTARMELVDIQTDEVTPICSDCGRSRPLALQADADMLASLFTQLFEAHGLNPARIGRLVIDAPGRLPVPDEGPGAVA